MLLAFAAGSIGLLLGLWFRVPALVAASMATAALCLLIAPFAELSPVSAAGMILALLSVLQGGYLVGLLVVSCRFSRRRKTGRAFWAGDARSTLGGRFHRARRSLGAQ
jgi:hypothetical protein